VVLINAATAVNLL